VSIIILQVSKARARFNIPGSFVGLTFSFNSWSLVLASAPESSTAAMATARLASLIVGVEEFWRKGGEMLTVDGGCRSAVAPDKR
jgi:hypothetical protein